jgi:acetolactate decarboxylase
VKALGVPGYHLHFLTSDRRAGGHLLRCAARRVLVQIQHECDFRVSLPENAQFLRADLTRDPSAELDRVER